MPDNLSEASRPTYFTVDYYAITPRGTEARFRRTVGLVQIRLAQSETAVLRYLKQLHKGCDIQIMGLDFH
jgi:hypothetical protein